ncbi:MAG: beta-lactamase protein [Ramlibacter sp.]|nr:beta-lactamase protein [Ramlibacter sp.]
MRRLIEIPAGAVVLALFAGCGGGGGGTAPLPDLPAREALIARANALELDTPYVPPPGNVLEHHTSGYAKTMCSAVFITGVDPAVAAETLGYFVGPYDQRQRVETPVVDRGRKEVRITIPRGPTLVARHLGSQGCVTLPRGRDDVLFTPVTVVPNLPDAASTPWPMGDRLPSGPPPQGVDMVRLQMAVDAAFESPSAYTSAFVVTYKGRLLGERYMDGINASTPLESWSMGKSVIATLMGVLIQQGDYRLDEPAPIPEWQGVGDPRRQIRISHILNMSSGLRITSPDDPDYDPQGPYPDHTYMYTGRIDTFNYAATRPQEWPPGKVGRYRNTDPVLASYLVKLAAQKRGEEYLSFPQRQLFDRIGIRSMVLETDPYGSFLTQGYDFMSARDWARLGNLYLQDGMWNGERILPAGFTRFVSTPAPAWVADKRPVYGGFFWLNQTGALPYLPPSAYYMLGAGGQYVIVVPSHDLVIVRIGHSKGQSAYAAGMIRALSLLMQAVPASR